jgi:hypothetical protein
MKAVSFAFFLIASLITLSAQAETIDVSDSHGGSVAAYDAHWQELAQRAAKRR